MNSKRKIIKTSHVQIFFFFFFFVIMKRIRKGSVLPEKMGVTAHPTKILKQFKAWVTARKSVQEHNQLYLRCNNTPDCHKIVVA